MSVNVILALSLWVIIVMILMNAILLKSQNPVIKYVITHLDLINVVVLQNIHYYQMAIRAKLQQVIVKTLINKKYFNKANKILSYNCYMYYMF